jgi:D-alanyl-D-alanine carboxypeptidase
MTSGIFDYTDDAAFVQGFDANPRQPFTEADFFAILARNPPAFAPGTAAVYCDSNYYLLGLILEKITGRPAGRVITDQIIRPLRLRNTSYPTGQTLPKPFAHGYFGGLDLTDPLRDVTVINPANGATAS